MKIGCLISSCNYVFLVVWWRRRGLNSRPLGCEPNALPAELRPHDMNIARQYTQRALVLHNGDLVFDGATADLYDGKSELSEWGLKQPIIATLSATFGVEAQNAKEFCEKLYLKEGVAQ